jgi:hypothetical protein
MPESEVWKLSGSEARLNFADLLATVDLNRPEQGLSALIYRGHSVPSTALLGVHFPGQSAPPVADAYVRQRDLVVTYVQSPALPIRLQVYWRAASGPQSTPAIDLQVSIQTNLLDSHPRLWTTTSLGDAEPIRFGHEADTAEQTPAPRYDLFRPAGTDFSYVEMIHPADDAGGANEVGRISRELFAAFLEKGVILRARLRGVFLPRHGDAELAAEAYQQFLAAPPPLTT